MAFLNRALIFISCLIFGAGALAQQTVNQAIVNVIPFASLQKSIHPFQTDCRNILREPHVEWGQFEVVRFAEQGILQLKISGEVNEDLDVRFWSRKIHLYDKKRKALKPVILPAVTLPLKSDSGNILVSLNVPEEAEIIVVPLELYSAKERFRYLFQIKDIHGQMTVEARPILDKASGDFCTRNVTWIGWGVMGASQKQDTSPIVTTLENQSFTFDNISFEKRWNWQKDRAVRVFGYTGTFQFNDFLNVSGGERIYNIQGDVAFTQRAWAYRNSLFKVQYGYLLGGSFERRPYAVIKNSTEGALTTGMGISGSAGGYAELFSFDNKWYTDVSVRLHPLYFGIDQNLSGLGLSGMIGIARPLDYEHTIGLYSYGTMFYGKHSGSDDKDNSDVTIFETHVEFRYGWLF